MSEKRQIAVLRKGANIVVATPGRLEDYLRRKLVDLRYVSVLVLDEAGRRDEAMQQRLAWLRLEEGRPDLADRLADVDKARGWEAAMDEWIEMMERRSRWTAAAFQSAVAGRSDHALDCLEHAQSQRFATFPLLLQAPSLRSLRGHPRFRAILRGLRLEERVWLEAQ